MGLVTILRGGYVVDPRRGLVEQADVVVRGDVIEALRPLGSVPVEADRVLDVAGTWLLPGLIDSHAHILGTGRVPVGAGLLRVRLEAYLQAGVTTIRDAGSPGGTALALAATLAAPLVRTAGRQIRSKGSPEDAASSAEVLASAGATWLKAYALEPSELADVLDVGRRARLLVGVHLGDDPAAGLSLGIEAIEHVYPLVRHDLVANDERLSSRIPAADAPIATWLLSEPTRPVVSRWYREVGDRHPFLVPTLRVMRGLRGRHPDQCDLVLSDEAPWATEAERLRWQQQLRTWGWWDISPGSSPELRLRALEQLGRATRFLAAAGCRICVGTDFDSPFIEPGAGVLAEMRDLETAGMERLDIIRAATSTAADLLGLTDQIGVVAPGARADLLVLRANPFETLEALARPELVIAAGRVVADRRPESST